MAEGVGFEPTTPCSVTVFKTVAFGRSAIPPHALMIADPAGPSPRAGRGMQPQAWLDPKHDPPLVHAGPPVQYPVAMKATAPEARLQAFRKILAAEARTRFRDRVVSGGLDRFLQRLAADLQAHPVVERLAGHGMLAVSYRELTQPRRQTWVREAQRILDQSSARPVAPVDPDSPVTALRSVSRVTAAKLQKLAVTTIRDLLYLFPRRHQDYSLRRPVAQLAPGQDQTTVVSLWEIREVRLGKKGLHATEAVVGDETGNIRVVWFGNRYLAKQLRRAMQLAHARASAGVTLVLSGKVTTFMGNRQFEAPEWEILQEPEMASLVHTGRLVPVYPSTELLSQRTIRRIVREALDALLHPASERLEDPLPAATRRQHNLMPLAGAVAQFHYPDSLQSRDEARHRLAFDELLVLQLALAKKRRETAPADGGIVLRPRQQVLDSFLGSLPFQLTVGQRAAIQDALSDMTDPAQPMGRLLQGDVGSGKTVVALALLLTAVANGYQGVLMAPTEVLAEQHYLNVAGLLRGLPEPVDEDHWFSFYVGGHPAPISVGLLIGSTSAAAKRELHRRANDGKLDILIGTHAVIQQEVELPRLALGIVDEQHRFGVLQRIALRGKGHQPHLLTMSATPIPRTLAMTLYGHLQVSTLPELPPGRQPIVTCDDFQQHQAEAFVVKQVERGRQAFVVCPLIEESEALQTRAATQEMERLSATSLSGLRLGLLHSRLPLRRKQSVMDAFRRGLLDVLVCTPVIEVGVDVPNATVMVIEGADRFGLAQLHQLRGRVGRGPHQSYCLLLTEAPSEEAQQRLRALVQSNDGFEIAETDLRLRGSGDFFGTRQSGLPALRVARLSDRELLAETRAEAQRLLADAPQLLDQGPLGDAVERYMQQVVDETG